ncbi:hypothetical protein CMK14_13715 [Candidatus Poribacteria bacterium]|nr:hypothetical protein [Candidatus Poribacteria bacterium]
MRMIPGSHLKSPPHGIEGKSAQHRRVPESVSRAIDMDHPILRPAAGETDVEVQAGDVVIGDSRLLYVSHANHSGQRRTVITIWYWPTYSQLPEEV